MERFKVSLHADLKAASNLTEGLSDVEMKAFLDTITSSCSEGQILTSGVGEHAHFLSILKHTTRTRGKTEHLHSTDSYEAGNKPDNFIS